jgi:hypothetical protein
MQVRATIWKLVKKGNGEIRRLQQRIQTTTEKRERPIVATCAAKHVVYMCPRERSGNRLHRVWSRHLGPFSAMTSMTNE